MRRLVIGLTALVVAGAWACGDTEPETHQNDGDADYGILQGQVLFEDESPAAQAGVHAEVTVEEQTTLVDDDGIFEFEDLEPGTYTVVASMEGFEEASTEADVEAGETTVVELVLGGGELECTTEEVRVEVDGQLECRLVCTEYGIGRCDEDDYCDEQLEACMPDDCGDDQRMRNLEGDPECLPTCQDATDCADDEHCPDEGVCMSLDCGEDQQPYLDEGTRSCRTVCDEDDDCGDDRICDEEDEVCVSDGTIDHDWDDGDYPPPTCEADPEPERCSADPDQFDFEPGSFIDQLELAEPGCCFDYTDDGEPDNAIGEMIDLADTLEVEGVSIDLINQEVEQAIDNGQLQMVLEHDGLEAVQVNEQFVVNALQADSVEDGEAVIDPGSFEEGTHPYSQLPNGTIFQPDDELVFVAGPGQFTLPPEFGEALLFGVELDEGLTAEEVRMTATPIASSAGVEGGVILEAGHIGGLVLREDVIELFNDSAAECECLDTPDEALQDGGDTCDIEDAEDKVEACDAMGDEACAMLGDLCSDFWLMAGMTDVDATGDGEEDAFSVGLEFEADAVTITGVATD